MQFIIGLITFLFFYLSFGIIRYYLTPPDVIRTKAVEFLMLLHLFASVVAAIKTYRFIDMLYEIENSFEDSNWKRIVFFLALIFSFVFIIGFLIEGLLLIIDKKYRIWRFQK